MHSFGPNSVMWMWINRISERALRIAYKDIISTFDQLLERSESVRIHHKNLQLLAIENFKALNLKPLMSDLFKVKETNYSIRNGSTLVSNLAKTITSGINSIFYLAPKIWDQIPTAIKECKSLNTFKQKIRKWIPQKCPCPLYKTYVANLGYI